MSSSRMIQSPLRSACTKIPSRHTSGDDDDEEEEVEVDRLVLLLLLVLLLP